MWEFVDKVIYINLDHRKDRREIMSKFFEKGQIPLDKVVRFSAIHNKKGNLGCLQSHTEVLSIAKKEGWKNVLILEDDLEWTEDFEEGYKKLEELVKLPKWDVIMIVGAYLKYDFPRIFQSCNTGGYLVNSEFYDTLLENRENAVNNLKSDIGFNFDSSNNNADIYWCKLMPISNWYGLYPCICRQVDGYSDIVKRVVESSKVVGIYTSEIKREVYKIK
jgi:GR25 family glycosyltransferase involved in LPS biosynthesis